MQGEHLSSIDGRPRHCVSVGGSSSCGMEICVENKRLVGLIRFEKIVVEISPTYLLVYSSDPIGIYGDVIGFTIVEGKVSNTEGVAVL